MNLGASSMAAAGTGVRDGQRAFSVERLIAGDRTEFDRLVRRQQDRVALLVSRLLGWPPDVGDVVQEVFVAALGGLGRFRADSSVETWLTRITINTCRSHRRRRLLRLRYWQRLVAQRRSADAPAADRAVMDGEAFRQVRRAVEALPMRYREVVVLRYLEELPMVEIGALLGVSRNVVEVRLNRARGKLRGALADLVGA